MRICHIFTYYSSLGLEFSLLISLIFITNFINFFDAEIPVILCANETYIPLIVQVQTNRDGETLLYNIISWSWGVLLGQVFGLFAGFMQIFYLDLVPVQGGLYRICRDEQFNMKIISIRSGDVERWRSNRFYRCLRFGFREGVDFLGWGGGSYRGITYQNRNGIIDFN